MNAATWCGVCALISLGCGGAAAPLATTPPPVASAPSDPAPPADAADGARGVVAAADRGDADRALDDGRKPAELLAFAGVAPGNRALDSCAGGGCAAELLARAVEPSGVGLRSEPRFVLGFAEKAWSERRARPATKNAVRVDTELDATWPKELGVVTLVLF